MVPFGNPVVPLVYTNAARSSFTLNSYSGGFGFVFAVNSDHPIVPSGISGFSSDSITIMFLMFVLPLTAATFKYSCWETMIVSASESFISYSTSVSLNCGFMGTKMAPAFSNPKNEISHSIEFGAYKATRSPFLTPKFFNAVEKISTCSLNCLKVIFFG